MDYTVKDIFTTRSEQARGLMFLPDYPDDCCAVFPYEEPCKLSFHGRNCLFPILAIFIRPDLTIDRWDTIFPDGPPVSSAGACSLVIELKACPENIDAAASATQVRIGDGIISLI